MMQEPLYFTESRGGPRMKTRTLLALMLTLGVALVGGCRPTGPAGPARVSVNVVVDPAVQDDPLAKEFQTDPVKFLEGGLTWYEANVKDYRTTLYKLERVNPAAADFLPEQKLVCKFK